MPSLNFKKQFVPGIRAMLDREYARRLKIKPKRTTIRAMRKVPIRKGDTLYLFTGLRTPHCERLGEVKCLKVETVEITEKKVAGAVAVAAASRAKKPLEGLIEVRTEGKLLSRRDTQAFAIDDGFTSIVDLAAWFKDQHGLPFTGQRIHLANTYDRKYYLNRKAKALDLDLRLEKTEKTIEITAAEVEKVRGSKYIRELMEKHSYGVQMRLEL